MSLDKWSRATDVGDEMVPRVEGKEPVLEMAMHRHHICERVPSDRSLVNDVRQEFELLGLNLFSAESQGDVAQLVRLAEWSDCTALAYDGKCAARWSSERGRAGMQTTE